MSANAIAKIDFNKEELAVIEAQFFPAGGSKVEQQYCFSVARELGLNPITKEIHFVPRKQKVGERWVTKIEPMVGRDGFLSIAHRSGQLAGIETAAHIREVPLLERGAWVMKHQLVAECVVWRKDSSKPFTAQVSYPEYCQRNSEGAPTKFWSEKPETMLKKVAESQALRKAFNIHGVYCPEELGAGFETSSGDIVPSATEAEFTREKPGKSRLTVVSAQPATLPPSASETADADLPVAAPPTTETTTAALPIGDVLYDIAHLLEGKGVPYEIDREAATISAKSYNERQWLKELGFKWSTATKSWFFQLHSDEL